MDSNKMLKLVLGSGAAVLLLAGIVYAADNSKSKPTSTDCKCDCSKVKDDDLYSMDPLAAWDPFKEMQSMRRQMNEMFRHSFARFNSDPRFGSSVALQTVVPSVNLSETDDSYVVTADIPGANETSVTAHINGDLLTISGSREQVTENKDAKGKVIFEERSSGRFERSLTLPSAVDAARMKTKYEDGVFTVTVPKAK